MNYLVSTCKCELFCLQTRETRRDRARALLIDLETRGSKAFQYFLECLRDTGYPDLAELLDRGDGAHQIRPTPVQPSVVPLPVRKCAFK